MYSTKDNHIAVPLWSSLGKSRDSGSRLSVDSSELYFEAVAFNMKVWHMQPHRRRNRGVREAMAPQNL